MERQKHFLDADGNHYVVPLYGDQDFLPPEGHTELTSPPAMGWLWLDGQWVEPPPSEPEPNYLFRSIFIARLSNEEAGILETALQQAEPKLRQMFYASEYFVSDDPLFAVLHWTVAEALGEARADELLAPLE